MTYPSINWKKENLEKDINILTEYAISIAESYKNYYKNEAVFKKRWAKTLRVTAIIATAFGGLLPIFSQIAGTYKYNLDPAWATVAFSIAITAVGLDRFFGFSSAWMRFITTQISIETRIEQFRFRTENEKFSWIGNPPTFDNARSLLQNIITFITEVSETVKDETNTWMLEFENVIQKFNEEIKAKTENTKLGGIIINITNSERFVNGLILNLDGKESITFHSSSCSVNNLYPKIYKVSIKEILVEKQEKDTIETAVRYETLVNVTPGNIATVTLTLK